MLKKILFSFGLLAIILTLLPLIPVDYWLIRMLDFPHLQLTLLTAIAIAVYFIRFNFKSKKDYFFLTVLVACVVFQFSKIYPYTSFSSKDILAAENTNADSLRVFIANVKQKNKKYDLLKKELKKANADIVVLTEVNKRWLNEIKSSTQNYEFREEYPLDNTYGIALYSKKMLSDTRVNFLVSDTIPSIETKLKLDNGAMVQLYAIHPTPPFIGQNKESSDRDTEMMMTAKKVMDANLPVLVCGDFNDVSWSNVNRLFERVSGLLDVRKGRGVYNTYSASNFITRWPLDHIFVSEEFRLKQVKVKEDIGSDHFPYYASFTFEPNKAHEQKPEKPSKQDLEEANDQIKRFKEKR